MGLYIQETAINKTKNYRYGESEVYETPYTTRGELYRALQKIHGRCTGTIDLERNDGTTLYGIGWTFEKRREYDDCADTYIKETWVTVHTAVPTKTVRYHYLEGKP